MTGPNPKYIFQGIVLIGSLLIFAGMVSILKTKTGEPIATLISEYKQLFNFAVIVVIVLVIIAFLIIIVVNN